MTAELGREMQAAQAPATIELDRLATPLLLASVSTGTGDPNSHHMQALPAVIGYQATAE